MSKRANLYLGRAGQIAVMAEFLARGWNVAIPEVDVGDDIFVVRDSDGNLSRIQVKTASVSINKENYSARFNVSLAQLSVPRTPELSYVFTVRRKQAWDSFVIIGRATLFEEFQLYSIGSILKRDKLLLTFFFSQDNVVGSGRDFTRYLNNWQQWPPIRH